MSSFYSFHVAMLLLSTLQRLIAPDVRRAPNLLDPVLAKLRRWRVLERSRRELASLSAYQLHDIGVSRSQAAFESTKSFLQD